MLLVCVVPVVVCGTLPLLALLIIRHMYTTSVVMVMVTATSTRSTVMYTPCSVVADLLWPVQGLISLLHTHLLIEGSVVGCTELMHPWLLLTCELMTSVGFLMVIWPVEEVYILAVTEIGILDAVYKGLMIVTSKLFEELLQTMLFVSQLCVVWVVSLCCVLATSTVVIVVSGALVAGLTLSQLLLVQVHKPGTLIIVFNFNLYFWIKVVAMHHSCYAASYVIVFTCHFHLAIHVCQWHWFKIAHNITLHNTFNYTYRDRWQ